MCYKEEKQSELKAKYEEKSANLPKFIKEYFIFLKSNVTRLNNLGTLTKMFEWFISKNYILNKLEELTPDDLKSITEKEIVAYLEVLSQDLKYTSVITKMNIIGGFWSFLVDEGYVSKNVVSRKVRDLYKVEEEHEIEVPSDEAVERLLTNLYNKKNEYSIIKYIAVVKLLIGSAIRLEEITGLDVNDVCLDDNEPYVLVMRKGKQNQKSRVPINKQASNALDDYLKVRTIECEGNDIDALFINKDHKNDTITRLSYRAIQDTVDRYSNKEIHAHLLRHYAATKMHENKADMAIISKQLGHKSMNTTMKSYAKISSNATYEALNSY